MNDCTERKHHTIDDVIVRSLKEYHAAKYIGMSRSYLRQARMDGNREGRIPGPRFIRIGRSIRYLIDDLDAWLEWFRVAEVEK